MRGIRFTSYVAIAALLLCITGLAVHRSHAGEPTSKLASADEATAKAKSAKTGKAAELVRQALEAEAAGDRALRDELLGQALKIDPDYAPAHWQQGEVRTGNRWQPVDAPAGENKLAAAFTKYRVRAAKTPAKAEDQLKLARWCGEVGLPEQEKIHFRAVLSLKPNKVQAQEAAAKLDLVRHGKGYIPAARVDAGKKKAKQIEADMKKWKPLLTRLRNDLESHDEARQEAARAQLATIDESAILPIEATFAKAKPEAAKAAVAAIAAIKGQAALESIMRHAVYATNEEVRMAAAQALKQRELFAYIPLLLASMNSPIEVEFHVYGYEGGAFGERLSLFREGPLSNTHLVNSTTAAAGFTPIPGAPLLANTGPAQQAIAAQAANDAQIAQAALVENERTEQMNKRIGQILRVVTDEDFDDDPRQWWSWWSAYNETHSDYDKPTYESIRNSYVYYSATYVPPTRAEPSNSGTLNNTQSNSLAQSQTYVSPGSFANARKLPKGAHWDVPGLSACFVPGTKVWTITGMMPIEKIQIGDYVLCQDADTGELAYKAVERTTVGPPLPLVELRAGKETIRCTYGHLFWISGQGWKMAKELEPGQLLHTTHGPLPIESVEKVGEASCHNLVIPDFNTYFVTDEKILVHDIDIRGPTEAKVPGLVEK